MDGTYLFNDTQYRSSLVGALLDCWTYDGIMMNDCTLMNIKTRSITTPYEVLADNEPVFVCRVSASNCGSCVDSIMSNFISLSDSCLALKQIIIGNYDPKSLSILFNQHNKKDNSIDVDLFCSVDSVLPIDDYGYPYYFVLDHDLKISNVFIPHKDRSHRHKHRP